jgi:2,3-bisphosphoglycerate-independent phosphoglycerate mutase
VPVAIRDPRHAADAVQSYDEVSVRAGSLGVMRGNEFFQAFLKG